ncbi:threonine/serine ThrE exporter family protein [Serinicoccus kebangsaanensis]|uniref:threonine/serine ThrE exporter family protein n=1 Tax=Serinicoccus kebangsaanensis TaxID=2602069 RepID=UPI00124BDA56|nr:threonine/serine exporter family protein [Serinicoccus kebangsaanensis]
MNEHTPLTSMPGEVTGPQRIARPQLIPAARLRRHLKDAAVHVVRSSSPPTTAIGVGGTADEASQRHARAVCDLALRVGEALLSTGASAADTVATVLRLGHAYGIRSMHIDITYTSISVSVHRGVLEDSLTVMRVITDRSPDYTRLEAVQRHIDDIVRSAEATSTGPTIDVEAATDQLVTLLASPHPYRRWVVTAGVALMSVGVVMLYGAGPFMWVVAALSAAIVDRVQRLLYIWGIAAFFTQVLSAAIPAGIALLMYAIGRETPSVVVISGIVVLLAGLSVLGAAQDAIDGYYVTAGARGLEVMMMTLGIAVGVALVLGIARRFGVSMEAAPFVALGGTPLISTVGAALIALGFCLSTYSGARVVVLSIVVASGAWLVLEAALVLGLATPAGVAVAAAVVGALAFASFKVFRVPEAAIATAGIVSLLPGLAVYRALYLIMQNNEATVPAAVIYFVSAVATGLGLAAGLAIGSFAARRRFGLDPAALRARRRSRGTYVAEA